MKKRKRANGRRMGRNSSNSNTGSDLESVARNESLASNGVETFNSQVRLRIDTFRVRLADADGISAKAIIDGLVHCGILRDDSTKEIAEPVEIYQHKVKTTDQERTEIRIKRCSK